MRMCACSHRGRDVCIARDLYVCDALCVRLMAQTDIVKAYLGMRDEYSAVCGSLEEPSARR